MIIFSLEGKVRSRIVEMLAQQDLSTDSILNYMIGSNKRRILRSALQALLEAGSIEYNHPCWHLTDQGRLEALKMAKPSPYATQYYCGYCGNFIKKERAVLQKNGRISCPFCKSALRLRSLTRKPPARFYL